MAAAPRTGFRFRRNRVTLPRQGLIHQGPGDRLADLNGEFLQIGEPRAPGHAVGAVDLLEEVFRHTVDEVLLLADRDRRGGLACHPWLLPGVTTLRCSGIRVHSLSRVPLGVQSLSSTRSHRREMT